MKKSIYLISLVAIPFIVAACGGSDEDNEGTGGSGGGDGTGGGSGGTDTTGGTGAGKATGGMGGDEATGGLGGDGATGGSGGSPTAECTMASECDDEDDCTDDVCTAQGVCTNQPAANSFCAQENECISAVLDDATSVECVASYTGASFSMCHEGDVCTAGGDGCDLSITYGESSWETSVDGSTRTSVLTLPVVAGALTGSLDTAGSDCVISFGLGSEVIPISVTMTSTVQNMCGVAEEVLSVVGAADTSKVSISITPGQGSTGGCSTANAATQPGGLLRSTLEESLETSLLESLNLDDLVGRDCLICETGDCNGFACEPLVP